MLYSQQWLHRFARRPYLSAHVATGHVGEDGLQHDLHGGGPLAEGGEDGEEAVPDGYGVQAAVEVLVLGGVEAAGTWRGRKSHRSSWKRSVRIFFFFGLFWPLWGG